MPAMQETLVRFLGQEVPLEKQQATHSSVPGLPLWLRRYRIHLQCGKPGLDHRAGRSPGGGHGSHSSILARRIPWTEEPGRLLFMGSQRVRHDRATKHSPADAYIMGFPGDSVVNNPTAKQETQGRSLGREDPLEKETAAPLQHSCPGNPMGRGARQATVHGGHKELDTT